MKHRNTISGPNRHKKTLQNIQYPNDFHFYYEKSDMESIDQMSPTSTCPSQGKSNYWQCQFQDKMIEGEKQEQNLTTVSFGSLEGNLLGICIQKYTMAVSNYIKQCLNYNSDKIFEFVLVREFQGLDLQKQQISNTLTKYYQSGKSINAQNDSLITQNPSLICFLEEITYLNYQQINFELILIISEIYSFKSKTIPENQNTKEFLYSLSRNQKIQLINFNFLKNQAPDFKRPNCYLKFLEKIFQIISELYVHYKVFQQDKDEQVEQKVRPEMIRNELKLFSSQRDIWDSDEEEEFMRLSCPNKKIKQFGND